MTSSLFVSLCASLLEAQYSKSASVLTGPGLRLQIRAAKQATKLANKAIKKSRETVSSLRRNSNASIGSTDEQTQKDTKKPSWRLPWSKSQASDRDPLITASPERQSHSDIDEKEPMAQLGAEDIPTITVVDDALADGTDQNSSSSAESTDVEHLDTRKLNVW